MAVMSASLSILKVRLLLHGLNVDRPASWSVPAPAPAPAPAQDRGDHYEQRYYQRREDQLGRGQPLVRDV
jgi:hypothetical protein